MREGTNEQKNERTYTTTKHITTLLLRSRVKSEELVYSRGREAEVGAPKTVTTRDQTDGLASTSPKAIMTVARSTPGLEAVSWHVTFQKEVLEGGLLLVSIKDDPMPGIKGWEAKPLKGPL